MDEFGGSRSPQHAGLHQEDEGTVAHLRSSSEKHGEVSNSGERRHPDGLGFGLEERRERIGG